MGTLWIIVAQRSEACIYRCKTNSQISLVHEIQNPEGRLKDHELGTDRPGRSFSSAGPQRHGFSPPVDPSEQVAKEFSREIADFLDSARIQNRYDHLVLIAGPKFLGRLRQDMSDATSKCIINTIAKNLSGLSEQEVLHYLREVVLEESDGSNILKSA
jgi:protein required for attachment to host cells